MSISRRLWVLAACLMPVLVMAAAVSTVETDSWGLYRGSSKVADFPGDLTACKAERSRLIAIEGATRTTGSNTYTCKLPQSIARVTYGPNVPPAAVDCVVSAWSEWSGGAWSACVNGTQARQETRTRTVMTPPTNGGAACPTLLEQRTATQACSVTPPTAGVIFRSDMSPGAAENQGWVTAMTEALLTRTYNPTGGPTGGGAYDYDLVIGAPGDNYYGVTDRTTPAAPAGGVRYYRWKWKLLSHSGPNVVNKFLITHDTNSGNQSRAMYQPEVDDTRFSHGFQQDGGWNKLTLLVPRPFDGWMEFQWEIRYSSAPNVADGSWKIWLNNNDYANPTIQRIGFIQNVPTGPDNTLKRMGYMNTGLTSGSHRFRVGAFEIANSFDANWHN